MGPSRAVCRLIDIDKFADVEHDGAEILQGTVLGQAELRLCNWLAGCGLGRIDFVDEQRALGQVQFQFVGAHGTAPGTDADVPFDIDWFFVGDSEERRLGSVQPHAQCAPGQLNPHIAPTE